MASIHGHVQMVRYSTAQLRYFLFFFYYEFWLRVRFVLFIVRYIYPYEMLSNDRSYMIFVLIAFHIPFFLYMFAKCFSGIIQRSDLNCHMLF